MSEAVLDIRQADIYQGESLILSNVNIQIHKSEFVYLVGKTGSGKSSLLKTLYGELPLKTGEAKVAGFDLKEVTWKTVPYLRRNIGIVFQDFQLLTDRNVHDNLKFVLNATGWTNDREIEDKIQEVLRKVGFR
jgi:cell division transport system ATP-binding protein